MDEQQTVPELELARFQGTWRTVAVEIDGVPLPAHLYQDARLVIAGNRFRLWNPLPDAGQQMEGSFELDSTKTPKELNLRLDSGQTLEEIYELESETLRVCSSVRGGARPTALSTTSGSGLSLVIYRRE